MGQFIMKIHSVTIKPSERNHLYGTLELTNKSDYQWGQVFVDLEFRNGNAIVGTTTNMAQSIAPQSAVSWQIEAFLDASGYTGTVARVTPYHPSLNGEPAPDAKMEVVMESLEGAKSTCFVVTACAGRADHPLVLQFQEFRDSHLIQHGVGKKFVALYYLVGPRLASVIDRSAVLRKFGFCLLKSVSRLLP